MKKLTKLLPCLLLTAALAIAIATALPTSAQAVDNSSISAQFAPGTTDAVCPVCNKMVTWKELTAKKTYSKDGDHYYLAQDLRWTESGSLFNIPKHRRRCGLPALKRQDHRLHPGPCSGRWQGHLECCGQRHCLQR